MTFKMMPPHRPQKTWDQLKAILDEFGYQLTEPIIFGHRGYYLDDMGVPGKNDRAIYDDACFLMTPNRQSANYNFNTDPSRFRMGFGTDEDTKGMAKLNCGIWTYMIGPHKGYEALVQADKVTVTRDGKPPYEDSGWFGINIHRGGDGTTSSLGCQTIPPSQWSDFIMTVKQYMKQAGIKRIKYVLIERQG